jgi:hypothetical protein
MINKTEAEEELRFELTRLKIVQKREKKKGVKGPLQSSQEREDKFT